MNTKKGLWFNWKKGMWRLRFNHGLFKLYNDPGTVKVIKAGRST